MNETKFPESMDAKVWAEAFEEVFIYGGIDGFEILRQWCQAALSHGAKAAQAEIVELRRLNLSATRRASEQAALVTKAEAEITKLLERYRLCSANAAALAQSRSEETVRANKAEEALRAKATRPGCVTTVVPRSDLRWHVSYGVLVAEAGPMSYKIFESDDGWRAEECYRYDGRDGTSRTPPMLFSACVEWCEESAAASGAAPITPPKKRPCDMTPEEFHAFGKEQFDLIMTAGEPSPTPGRSFGRVSEYADAPREILIANDKGARVLSLETLEKRIDEIDASTRSQCMSIMEETEARHERNEKRLGDLETTHHNLISAALEQNKDIGATAAKAASRVGQLWQKQTVEMKNANQRIGVLEAHKAQLEQRLANLEN
jgi:hypothetical protein